MAGKMTEEKIVDTFLEQLENQKCDIYQPDPPPIFIQETLSELFVTTACITEAYDLLIDATEYDGLIVLWAELSDLECH